LSDKDKKIYEKNSTRLSRFLQKSDIILPWRRVIYSQV
jgi:hypothetical protein